MTDQIITCPNCATQIPLSDALTEKIRHQLQAEVSEELTRKEQALAEKTKALEASQKSIEEQIAKKLEAEKSKLWEAAQEKANQMAAEKFTTELKDLQQANATQEAQLKSMREQELELRKQKREIEEKEKNLALELERKLDEERRSISEQAKKDAAEDMRLKIAEKDKQMDQLRKSLEEARRKSEQGSMQIQGDVQEEDLKLMLQNTFPMDTVEDVPTGVKGADLIQTVNATFGQKTGVILWESKNTKTWSDEWVKKLKGDQALIKADVCILVSQSLPPDVRDFKFHGGVWICSYQSVVTLVTTLRLHLIQLSQVKQSMVGKDQKMEVLYNYLSGSEFQNRIENIVTAFTSMRSDLETEKRSLQRIWAKREKEIERVIMSTSGMYGDLQGIVGASLPAIESLELPSGDEDTSTEASTELSRTSSVQEDEVASVV